MAEINIYQTGSDLLRFISKRWWIIVLSTLIGTAVGFIKTPKPSQPIYETQLTCEAINISNLNAANIVNTLATSANSHNYKQLAIQLGCEDIITKDIKGLRAKGYINTDPIENLNNNIFTITILTTNISAIPQFIPVLKKYVDNDQLFKNKGHINISRKFNIPKKPANSNSSNPMFKFSVLFFALGLVISVLINFIVNVRAYEKSLE